MRKMLTAERRNKLAQIINDNGSIRVKEIADYFGVTSETIRKDLIILNNNGLVRKSHGGAIAISESYERPIDTRSTENQELKGKIAARALDLIESNNVIIIDSGSTLLTFAKMFPQNRQLTLITNSMAAANILAGKGNNICFVGGELSDITMSTSGMLTSYALNIMKADIAFLGTSGFQSHTGPCAKTFIDGQTKIDMIKNSKIKVVLADSSKFKTNAIVQYANWSEIDYLITDGDAPEEAVKEIRKKTTVIIAK
ncbi:MAG: DeoR/GlpR transcriptional regulator [Clostridiaceae bacterium]|nr:DeoR/GlpR transcriptional regulator [Clostridiaceae bacterium]